MTTTLAECTLDIGGMTCASCVRRVEKALTKVAGVASAQVNLATEVVTVKYDAVVDGVRVSLDGEAAPRAHQRAGLQLHRRRHRPAAL